MVVVVLVVLVLVLLVVVGGVKRAAEANCSRAKALRYHTLGTAASHCVSTRVHCCSAVANCCNFKQDWAQLERNETCRSIISPGECFCCCCCCFTAAAVAAVTVADSATTEAWGGGGACGVCDDAASKACRPV